MALGGYARIFLFIILLFISKIDIPMILALVLSIKSHFNCFIICPLWFKIKCLLSFV